MVVIAWQLAGGPLTDSPYAPGFLLESGTVDVPADLPPLALQALDRVDGDNSGLPGLWEDGYAQVLAERQPFRAALERAVAGSAQH